MINDERKHWDYIPLKTFYEKSRFAWQLVAFGLIAAYGIKIFNISISHDTEAIMAVADNLYNSWYTLGRFGLIFLKKILGTYTFNPYVASFFMVVMMFINGIIWMYLFTWIQGKGYNNANLNWVFPILFFTSMIFAEQSGFILQSFEVGVALLMLAVALLNCFKGILEKRKWYYFLPSIVCCVIAFSAYQTFVLLFAAGAAACFLLLYDTLDREQNRMSFKFCWTVIGKLIVVFVISYVIYGVINKSILSAMGLETSSYITDQVVWGSLPIAECLNNIMGHIVSVLKGDGIFYSTIFGFSCIGMIVYVGCRFKKDIVHNFMYILALIFCMISPFLMTIFMGSTPTVRTQLLLPFISAFFMWYILSKLSIGEGKVKRICYLCVLVFICIMGIQQIENTSRLYYTQYVQYEEDVRLAEKISDRIDKLGLGESPSEPVIFVGARTPQTNAVCIDNSQLELVGKSFFQVSFGTAHGTWVMNHFLDTIGYSYVYPSVEQISAAEQIAVDMPAWPNEGAVLERDGCIIIKLN